MNDRAAGAVVDVVEDAKIALSRKLMWLANLLWGGALLLAYEHVWHGEVVPWFPFLTAASDRRMPLSCCMKCPPSALLWRFSNCGLGLYSACRRCNNKKIVRSTLLQLRIQENNIMTLLFTVIAAIVCTIICYSKAPKDEMKVGTLCIIYWSASLMWFVDAIFEYAELKAEFFTPAIDDMVNDAYLGFSVVALGLIVWLVILLIKYPKGKVKAALLKKQ